MIPIVIGALGTVPKGLIKGAGRGRIKTTQTTALLRSAIILRVLETCHSDSSERPLDMFGMKNSKEEK